MKKQVLALTLAATATATLSGCAFGPYQPGFLYSEMNAPIDIRDNSTACEKRGESKHTNILGLVSTGDAGIEKAKANGGIKTVGNVDVHYKSILGVFSETTTIVCGK